MPQPTAYDRQNSFTLIAQENPAEPYTGAQLDEEFNALKVTLDEILANLELIQADDGDLANASVGQDQLAAELDVGINPPTNWATDTPYQENNTVFDGSSMYRALEAHTSGTFATDLAAEKWVLVADFLGDFDPLVLNDGDVTTAKIADLAVTTAKLAATSVSASKLAANAVETAKILDANVTEAKIATDAVTTDKIGTNAVSSDKIVDEAVTLAKMQTIATDKLLGRSTAGTGAVEQITCTAAGRALLDDADATAQRVTLDAEQIGTYADVLTKTDNHTLALTDVGKLLLMNSASAKEFTIPANATVAWPVDKGVDFGRLGAGALTIKGATGVTINGVSAGTITVSSQYGGATGIKIATNNWFFPNLEAA